jgi:hypothetical protein
MSALRAPGSRYKLWQREMKAFVAAGDRLTETPSTCPVCHAVFRLTHSQAELVRYTAGDGVRSGSDDLESYQPICDMCA